MKKLSKLPAECRTMEQSHVADICVFTGNFFTAVDAATLAVKQRDKGRLLGVVEVGRLKKPMYWCKVGLANDPDIFKKEAKK